MARDAGDIVTLTANAGGEGSGAGVKELYDMPTTPTGGCGRVKKITITNRTGADGLLYLDDNESDTTAIGAVADHIFNIPAGETVILEDEDLNWVIRTGVIAAASNALTGSGYECKVNEVDILK